MAGRNGDGNPGKDRLIRKLALTGRNKEDLLASLQSLTDEDLLHDAKYADPW